MLKKSITYLFGALLLGGLVTLSTPLSSSLNAQQDRGKQETKNQNEEEKEDKFVKAEAAQKALETARNNLSSARNIEGRVQAIQDLVDYPHPKTASFLIQILPRLQSEETLSVALETIQKTGDFRHGPQLVQVFSAFQNDDKIDMLPEVIRTAGKMGSRRIQNSLLEFVKSGNAESWEAAAASARALGDLNDMRALNEMIERYKVLDGIRQSHAQEGPNPQSNADGTDNITEFSDGQRKLHTALQKAINKITGLSTRDPDKMQNWYEKNQRQVQKTIREQQKKEQEKWEQISQ